MEEQSPSEPELGYQDYYDLGIRYLSEGNYEEAIIAFTASIEIEPKQAGAYVGRAEAYVKTGETVDNLEAARLDYEKILELDEAAAEAYLGLADVHIRRGEYEEALEILREGIERTGDIQPFQDKIFEIENSYGLSSEKENPLVALLHAGDDGNLLRADEVTIFGYNPENVSLSRAEQIFEQNGFDCERAGLALMGYKGLPSSPPS